MQNKKKIFIIIGIITLSIIIAIILIIKNKNNQNKIISQTQIKKISKVSENKIFFPFLGNKEKIHYFSNIDFKFHTISSGKDNAGNELTTIPNTIFWAPDASKILFTIDDLISQKKDSSFYNKNINDGDIAFWVLNLKTNEKKYLGKNFRRVSWGNISTKFYIFTVKSKENSEAETPEIIIKNAINYKNIKDILVNSLAGFNLADYSSKTEEAIYCSIFENQNGIIININTKKQKNLPFVCNYDNTFLSPDTNYIANILDNKLFIFSKANNQNKEFNILTTKTKIIWSADEKYLYTATTQTQKNNYDDFYKINVETGEKTLLFKSSDQEHYSAENLMITQNSKTLYFTSDDYLYKMGLE